MKPLLLALLLFGCGQNALPVCTCPAPPDGGAPDLSADLGVAHDLAQPRDLTTPIDLMRGDALGTPEILELLPAAPVRVGDTVKLLGRDFGCARMSCYLQLDSNYVYPVMGSDDSTITFVVPSLTLPANGKYVDLTVSNGVGVAHKTITVLPLALVPAGEIDLLWRDVDHVTLDANQTTSFHFVVRSRANQTLPVTVTAQPSNLTLSAQVVDSAAGMPLAPGETRDLTVKLIAPAGNATTSLRVRATAGAISGFFNITGLQVGAAVPPQELDMDLRGKVLIARSSVDDLIAVEGLGGELQLLGELRAAGTFAVDAQVSSADWSLQWLGGGAPPQFIAAAGDLTNGPVTRNAALLIKRVAADPAPAFLTVTVQQAPGKTRTLRYRLLSAE